jgi:hypothetical protein
MARRVAGTPSLSASRLPIRAGHGSRGDVRGIPALHDGAAEQPLGARHRKQRSNAHAPGRLAEDRDLAGVTAESRYVLPHPFKRGDLVEQAQVGDAIPQVEKALRAHPVIDGHAHHAVACKPAPVVEGRRAGGVKFEHTARDPDHHSPPRCPELRRPDVERQAVLARPH